MPTEFYKGKDLKEAYNKAIKDLKKSESIEQRRERWFLNASVDEEALRKFLTNGFPDGLEFRDIEKEILNAFLDNPQISHSEIAKNLGVSPSTVKTNLERAKNEIRLVMAKLDKNDRANTKNPKTE